MSTAVLLNYDDPNFDFDHAMAHRLYYVVMFPLNRFSSVPYFIEPWPIPPPDYPGRADMWNLDHQAAHNDFSLSLPPNWTANTVGFGIPENKNLVDSDLNNPESRTWWTFANHLEHYVADGAIFPLPIPPMVSPPSAPGWGSEVTYNFTYW